MKYGVLRFFLRWCIAFCGLAMIAAGVYGGEARAVFTKAIYICLECIGIG